MATGSYKNLQQLINDSQQQYNMAGYNQARNMQTFLNGYYGTQTQPFIQPPEIELTLYPNVGPLTYDVRAIFKQHGMAVKQDFGVIDATLLDGLGKEMVVRELLAGLRGGRGLQETLDRFISKHQNLLRPKFAPEVEAAFKKLKRKVTKDLALA